MNRVIDDFGVLVTEMQGADPLVDFHVPLGVLSAQEVRQIAVSFQTDTLPNPAVTPQGSLTLSVDIGIAPINPRVTSHPNAFAPLATNEKGTTGPLRFTDINRLLTNIVYELEVHAPAQGKLTPVALHVVAKSNPASTVPTIWSFISSCIVSVVVGPERLSPTPDPA